MKDIDDTKQPLLEHLIELRRRLFWCLGTLVVFFTNTGACDASHLSEDVIALTPESLAHLHDLLR